MYANDNRKAPNYTQMKIAFDAIDLRKDGMIDMNEWVKAFSAVNVACGSNSNNISHEVSNRLMLREWEMNMDMRDVYKVIWKHKQLIKNALKQMTLLQCGNTLIQPDNLVNVLKELLPQVKINNTQWKMVAMIGKNEASGLVDVDMFFKVLESSVKDAAMFRPRKQFK
jgi:Ca2+-binding EF-hand superfamily protein